MNRTHHTLLIAAIGIKFFKNEEMPTRGQSSKGGLLLLPLSQRSPAMVETH
jgi:hypothetical protein